MIINVIAITIKVTIVNSVTQNTLLVVKVNVLTVLNKQIVIFHVMIVMVITATVIITQITTLNTIAIINLVTTIIVQIITIVIIVLSICFTIIATLPRKR